MMRARGRRRSRRASLWGVLGCDLTLVPSRCTPPPFSGAAPAAGPRPRLGRVSAAVRRRRARSSTSTSSSTVAAAAWRRAVRAVLRVHPSAAAYGAAWDLRGDRELGRSSCLARRSAGGGCRPRGGALPWPRSSASTIWVPRALGRRSDAPTLGLPRGGLALPLGRLLSLWALQWALPCSPFSSRGHLPSGKRTGRWVSSAPPRSGV
mmetsp:Transcript_4010/g.16038  ORF Transcript_4010/g.16038 Transcript_4010/m.16038 type:complete len:207 (+) Transcript_4010:445-1065(+)